jgi:hypothetical protein
MRKHFLSAVVVATALFTYLLAAPQVAPGHRVGIIGLDTSHAVAFTKELNNPDAASDLRGYRVVAAYPQGSLDIESSTSRIPRYTKEVQEMGVEIVDSISALLDRVDVVLLETNDGRRHLEQAIPVLKAGKRVFIDKPVAASLADTVAIYDAAAQYGVPVFSSSSLRYVESAQQIRAGSAGRVLRGFAYSPAHLEPTHPDLFWYGIHGVELLYTVMGTGCESVVRTKTDLSDVVVGTWTEGRTGIFQGLREGKEGYGGTAFGSEAIQPIGSFGGYRPLLVKIAEFFDSGISPVSVEETLEIYTFMAAAHESERLGGVPVSLSDVLERARREAAASKAGQ